MSEDWIDLGPSADFKNSPVTEAKIGKTRVAISWSDGAFGAVSGVCNHAGGPLGQGTLEGEYLTCPWHYWKFHRRTGLGEPGYEEDAVPRHDVKIEMTGSSTLGNSWIGSLTSANTPSSATMRMATSTPAGLRSEVSVRFIGNAPPCCVKR